MGIIKSHHQVLCRGNRSLNESVPSALPWMSRPSPGIKRRPFIRATTAAQSRS